LVFFHNYHFFLEKIRKFLAFFCIIKKRDLLGFRYSVSCAAETQQNMRIVALSFIFGVCTTSSYKFTNGFSVAFISHARFLAAHTVNIHYKYLIFWAQSSLPPYIYVLKRIKMAFCVNRRVTEIIKKIKIINKKIYILLEFRNLMLLMFIIFKF
jgi:hypothetical protein